MTRKSSDIAPMTKIQRLAASCITGALRTTPTTSLEYILDLSLIDIFAENLAAKSAERLKTRNELSYRTYGQDSINRNNIINMDYMAPVLRGEKRFKISIGREGWRKGFSSKYDTLNLYANSSKMTSGVGAGIYCPELDLRKSYKLPNHCNIFQTEVFAVGKTADYQAAIIITSKIVLHSREVVERLAANCKLQFY